MAGKTLITDESKSPQAQLRGLPLEDVRLGDGLLGTRNAVNGTAALLHQYEELRRTGRIDNYRIAAGITTGEIEGRLASDSDVCKWAEAVSYHLATHPDAALRDTLTETITLIGRAQEESGYLNTSFIGAKQSVRWQNLAHGHELYCGGHMIQAAVAHHRATGDTAFLDIACRWADHVHERFGPDRVRGTAGHPEVEMALVELYRETGEQRYLESAGYFIDERGRETSELGGSVYLQDHAPVREQRTMAGHAVRQLYLLCGIADLYAETGDQALWDAMMAQWIDFTARKATVTGGAGPRYAGEAFGAAYEIPNRTGYYETCAAIASFMWNWRLLNLTAQSRYADEMETVLYNGLLSGVSLDGMRYFYTNPLEHDGGEDLAANHRGSNRRTTDHFNFTACCPPNVARLLASLPGYIYGFANGALYVHHYTASTASVAVGGVGVRVSQETDYPWSADVKLAVDPRGEVEFALRLRVPSWTPHFRVAVNGTEFAAQLADDGYASIARTWRTGDTVELSFAIPVDELRADPRVAVNAGCVALRRGPVVYCIESVDFPNTDLYTVELEDAAALEPQYSRDTLGGVVALTGEAVSSRWPAGLYAAGPDAREGEREAAASPRQVPFTAIPYYAWANRGPGAMRVWIPRYEGRRG
jgi:uncharacterized protein